MDSSGVTVFLYKGGKHYEIPLVSTLTAEDIVFTVAKYLGFRPISLNLFGLRIQKRMNLWLPPSYKFDTTKSYQVEFRMRFKLPTLNSLSRLDENSFDYLFHQIRYDLLNGQIPEFCLEQYKPKALGLCTTDMKRVILEDGLNRDDVVNNYRQYIPKSIYKQHFWFLKRKIQENIPRSFSADHGRSVKYLKEQYVNQTENLAPGYLAEEFTAMTYRDEEYPTTVRIDPFHAEHPGLSMVYVGKQNVSCFGLS